MASPLCSQRIDILPASLARWLAKSSNNKITLEMHAINLSKMMLCERHRLEHTQPFFIHSCVRNAFGILLEASKLFSCRSAKLSKFSARCSQISSAHSPLSGISIIGSALNVSLWSSNTQVTQVSNCGSNSIFHSFLFCFRFRDWSNMEVSP